MINLRYLIIFFLAITGSCITAQESADPPPLAGIGATVTESIGGARIATVLTGGAAYRSGEIRTRDLIIAVGQGDVNPVSVRGKSISEIVELIRGTPGSEVRLTILPADNRVVKQKIVALKRATISAPRLEMKAELGKQAPDFSTTHLAEDKIIQLNSFQGKIVVLEFWATWCGPCQTPMAKMQTYAANNPKWGDRVVTASLSVDRDRDALTEHIAKRNWNKTLNLWDSHGAAATYKIDAIPEVFVIDSEGIIRAKGHPSILDVQREVNRLLGIEEIEKELEEGGAVEKDLGDRVPVIPE